MNNCLNQKGNKVDGFVNLVKMKMQAPTRRNRKNIFHYSDKINVFMEKAN